MAPQEQEKRTKVKKGSLAVRVGFDDGEDGGGGGQKFVIPISYLYHPLFRRLLEAAQEVYGYRSTGPLQLPCSVDEFLHLRWRIERESSSSPAAVAAQLSHGGGGGASSSHHHSFSLYSC